LDSSQFLNSTGKAQVEHKEEEMSESNIQILTVIAFLSMAFIMALCTGKSPEPCQDQILHIPPSDSILSNDTLYAWCPAELIPSIDIREISSLSGGLELVVVCSCPHSEKREKKKERRTE